MRLSAAALIAMLALPATAFADANIRQIHDHIKAKYPERDVGGRVIIDDPKAFVAHMESRFGKPVMVGSEKVKTDYGWLVKVRDDSYGNCIQVSLSPKKQAVTYPLDVGITKCNASSLERYGYKVTGEIDNRNK